MIKIDKWKSSITRTVAGNSTYRFPGLFESDKLRIEIKLLNPNIQAQVLSLELTVEYQESIRDEIFLITPDYRKSIAEIIKDIKPYPFKLSVFNRNKSPISILASLPKLMPFVPQDNPAIDLTPLVNATGLSTAAINNLITATNAQPSAIATALANDDFSVLPAVTYTIGSSPVTIVVANDNNQGLQINHSTGNKVRLWAQDAALGINTTFTSDGYFIELSQKGLYEVPKEFCKTNIYAISNNAGSSISVTRSVAI